MVRRIGARVIIDNEAKYQLKLAFQYIKKDSVQNAEKVRSKIIESFKKLSKRPEQHPPDKYKNDNDGSFRAYELYKLRISYQVSPNQINIIRVRSTKMDPLNY